MTGIAGAACRALGALHLRGALALPFPAGPFVAAVSLLAATLLQGCGEAADPARTGPASLAIESGSLTPDFGAVGRRGRMLHEIRIRNRSARPVHLHEPQTSCGSCSPLSFGASVLEPGESKTLVLRLQAGDEAGEARRRMVIETDVPDCRRLDIVARWVVEPALVCAPDRIEFGTVRAGSRQAQTVRVRHLDPEQAVAITTATCSSPYVQVHAERIRRSGVSVRVPVSILPSAPPGRLAATVTLKTDSEREPEIHLPVAGQVVGDWRADADYVSLGVFDPTRAPRESFRIRKVSDASAQLKEVVYDESLIQCAVRPEADGGWVIDLEPRGAPDTGVFATTVTLRTTSRIQPEIHIPVLGASLGRTQP